MFVPLFLLLPAVLAPSLLITHFFFLLPFSHQNTDTAARVEATAALAAVEGEYLTLPPSLPPSFPPTLLPLLL